ncbi:MAG: CARDB domain-containing protein [Verrucomicrobiia bacterium]
MTAFLLKLLNAGVEGAGQIVHANLRFYPQINIALFVLFSILTAVSIYLIYKNPAQDISRSRRNIMAGLRIAFIILLLFILLRPTLSMTIETNVRRALLCLFDNSASMLIRDFRNNPADITRAAIAKGFIRPSDSTNAVLDKMTARSLEQISRIDIIKSVLMNADLNLINQLNKTYDLNFYKFGNTIHEINILTNNFGNQITNVPRRSDAKLDYSFLTQLNGDEKQTAIGEAIRDLINKKRGSSIAGIVLITDGANNSGCSPVDMAEFARNEEIPIYVYGVGITSPKDVIMISLFAQDVAFAKEETTVAVRIKSQGMAGKSSKLKLYLNNSLVDEKNVEFHNDSEISETMKFTPKEKGYFELKAVIEPDKEETVQDNNSLSKQIKVIDQKIKVLLVEQYPRWEYRYLLAKLMRDRRVELKSVLFESDPEVAKYEGSIFLQRFPESKEELFKYDLIIIGDVDSKNFSQSQMDNISELVSKFGGGFIMIAGKKFSPWSYRKTAIEKLLPVEFETVAIDLVGDSYFEKPVGFDLTESGKQNLMLRLGDSDDANLKIWRNLPKIYWDARVSRAKPAAEVLLVDTDSSKESRFGKMPIIALQQYGVGQSLFIGTDNTWRWRKNEGEPYHGALWIQIIQRMAMPKLLGGSKRIQISVDKQNYLPGERINVMARMYTPAYEPLTTPTIKAVYATRSESQNNTTAEVTLRLVQDQPGVYRGEFIAPTVGLYKFFIQNENDVQIEFNVTEPRFEYGETALNETLLRQIARISGGEYFREEDLSKLPQTIRSKTKKVNTNLEIQIWSSPIYFILLLSILTAEWILRKKSLLK